MNPAGFPQFLSLLIMGVVWGVTTEHYDVAWYSKNDINLQKYVLTQNSTLQLHNSRHTFYPCTNKLESSIASTQGEITGRECTPHVEYK